MCLYYDYAVFYLMLNTKLIYEVNDSKNWFECHSSGNCFHAIAFYIADANVIITYTNRSTDGSVMTADHNVC